MGIPGSPYFFKDKMTDLMRTLEYLIDTIISFTTMSMIFLKFV
jgi:hypothetical protein